MGETRRIATFTLSVVDTGTTFIAIPTRTHHGNCGEQTTIAGHVQAKTTILIVVSVNQVGIGTTIHQESAHSFFGKTETSGTHGSHRIIPTPGLAPVPIVPNPVEGIGHDIFAQQTRFGHHTERTQNGHVIGGVTNVDVGVGSGFGSEIQFIFVVSQRRQFIENNFPFHIFRHSQTLTPSLGHVQSIMPIRKFERRIDGFGSTQSFLSWNGAFQHVTVAHAIVISEICHEFSRFENEFGVRFPQSGIGGMITIHQFGHVENMRLLPNKERTHFRRRFGSRRIGHLHPTNTLKTLTLCNFTSHIFSLEIPIQARNQEFVAVPKSEVNTMPPVHFQVIFSKPTVVGKSRFLRRIHTCTLDGGKILRQHHATFQFEGTFILTQRKIDGTAIFPERLPIIRSQRFNCLNFSLFCQRRSNFYKFSGKIDFGFSTHQIKSMSLFCLLERSLAFPRNLYIVCGGIQHTLQNNGIGILRNDAGRMLFRTVPIGGIIAVLARRIRKFPRNLQLFFGDKRRSHAGSNHVFFRMTESADFHSFTGGHETAIDATIPHIQSLVDILQIVCGQCLCICVCHCQTHITQMHTMRIFAIIIGSRALTSHFVELHGIRFLLSTEIIVLQSFFRSVFLRIRKTMPSPLRHGSQGHTQSITFGERLQTGSIHRHGKIAITHRNRRQRIHLAHFHCMTSHQSLAIDGLRLRV